jgi:hypothetical protein
VTEKTKTGHTTDGGFRNAMNELRSLTKFCLCTVVVIVAVLAGASCRAEKRVESDEGADSARTGTAGLSGVTTKDFAALRWIEGSWRGTLPDGGYFYERYRFSNDSTIVMHGFADSTFANATDSARITLRDGKVYDEGATARWAATRLDSNVVAFQRVQGASNSFSWGRESPNRWTATLHSTDRSGRVRTTVYPMERVR